MKRYLFDHIKKDLAEKMVFIGGARQVGKTTLALSFLGKASEVHPAYFNWDNRNDKKSILNLFLPPNEKLIIYDEIHKYRGWRNLIKGIYDKNKSRLSLLVTGSARLDYYRRGGDSLLGRYHYYRLHPLSLGELSTLNLPVDLDRLLEFGGFPEVFFKASKKHWRRWQNERLSRVISDDLVNLERVLDVSQLTLLAETLPSKVGSPLSIQSLTEDLLVTHKTVKRWLDILANLYFCFSISPYGAPKIRAVKKEQKFYLYDWSLCEDPGARFENLVASQLLKYCHFIEDTEGHRMDLRYLRDTDKREVDFVVLKDKKPVFAVEAKLNSEQISNHLKYFSERTKIPQFYQVHSGQTDYEAGQIRVLPFQTLVQELGLP